MNPVQDLGEDGDWGEFWRKCPIYDLSLCMGIRIKLDLETNLEHITASNISSALGRLPLLDCSKSAGTCVFFDGKVELILPAEYSPVILDPFRHSPTTTWYGDRMVRMVKDSRANGPRPYRPRASNDGTRFLVQGHAETPILVDISKVL